ncbi:MAG: hypothetical protein A2W28_04005 [Gammaproteobacteria bacterium RBG_16_51_14]|nr:MAG: hypothetical protein A2W28_04005 [Gammaproteobacteria bacterium RBG_16_51_14]
MEKKIVVILALINLPITGALAESQNIDVLGQYELLARKHSSVFTGFSAPRGETLFRETYEGGNSDTPSCTSCHSTSPHEAGKTRAGKKIDPMALSKTPDRYADFKKTEKWFYRNCRSVMGRECTTAEKGDFITFMTGK